LSLIAGQFIAFDNSENSGNTQLNWDAYQFQQQLLAKLHIGDKLTLTWAPGFIAYNDASVGAMAVNASGNLVPPTNTFFNGGQPLNNAQPFPLTQRDLFILLAPGISPTRFTANQVGISSIDPNINSSNFALSNLNTEGWEFNVAYNLTDFLTASLTFYYSDALTKNLYGALRPAMYPASVRLSNGQSRGIATTRFYNSTC
jgi:hypothetical protein